MIAAPLFKNPTKKDTITLSEDASHDFTPRSPHLEFPSDGRPLKDASRGRRCTDDVELQHSVREKLRLFIKGFYTAGTQRLEKIVLTVKQIQWEINLNFVQDVPTISVNFVIIVTIVSEKKIKRYYFRTDLRNMEASVE